MIEGRHYQNAYITRDIDKAVKSFQDRSGVKDVMRYEGPVELTTPRGRGIAVNKLAFIWIDGLQYELIEPVSGLVDIYRDALPADDSLRFHHVCMRVDNWDIFRAKVEKQKYPVVLEGDMGAPEVPLPGCSRLPWALSRIHLDDARTLDRHGRTLAALPGTVG